jgi:hypothetical protein
MGSVEQVYRRQLRAFLYLTPVVIPIRGNKLVLFV